jgi:hypothetical protein
MSTLGEKVTETITGAIGKGLAGFSTAQHADMKAIIGPRIEKYLAAIPEGSVERAELEHLTAESTITDQLMTMFGVLVGLIKMMWALGDPAVEAFSHNVWQAAPAKFPGANTAISAAFRGAYSAEELDSILLQLGYDDPHREALKLALRTMLSQGDIIDLYLRGEIAEDEVRRLMEAAGIDNTTELYLKILAKRIPGISDVIRMAVRGAFTPEISDKFGLGEGFPDKVAELAAKNGIDAELAAWYWAAHWDLPSIGEGFEMLHRGLIKEEDLDQLLEAQAVMPHWRENLKVLAHNPLTRVDLRRMYQLGIIGLDVVLDGYKKLGYDDTNAARLTEFCKRYYGVEDDTQTVTDLNYTKAEILSGYQKKVITRDQTSIALQSLGYTSAQADFYIAQKDLQVDQDRKDAYITAYQALYDQGLLSADEVTINLQALGLGAAEINDLIGLWYLQRFSRVARPTKAERTRWLKAGIITEGIWTQEMKLDGYSDTYISWYLAEIKATPGIAIQEEAPLP